jgi:hypothetical protein
MENLLKNFVAALPVAWRRQEENPLVKLPFRCRKNNDFKGKAAPKSLSPERVGGRYVPGSYYVDSKSGGQKICYPEYKTHDGPGRFQRRSEISLFYSADITSTSMVVGD